jgi:hypothetical protein
VLGQPVFDFARLVGGEVVEDRDHSLPSGISASRCFEGNARKSQRLRVAEVMPDTSPCCGGGGAVRTRPPQKPGRLSGPVDARGSSAGPVGGTENIGHRADRRLAAAGERELGRARPDPTPILSLAPSPQALTIRQLSRWRPFAAAARRRSSRSASQQPLGVGDLRRAACRGHQAPGRRAPRA